MRWICPVCGSENGDTWICGNCGYDESRNYPRYGSVGKLTEQERRQYEEKMRKPESILRPDDRNKEKVFGSGISRFMIRRITLIGQLKDAPAEAWDVSFNRDKSVLAWTQKTEDGYDLYLAGRGKIQTCRDAYRLFGDYNNLEEIRGLALLDTSQAEDMSYMFADCHKLKRLDVSGFDTSRVTDMIGMFCDCQELRELDVSGLITSQVKNMSSMFYGCKSLKKIDVSGFNTSQVTDMSGMFGDCEKLEELDVSGFNTSRVKEMCSMFYGCKSLKEIDVSGFNTSRVTNMQGMFNFCEKLMELDVSGFNTRRVKNMALMFNECKALKKLDLTGFDTSQATRVSGMFDGCTGLEDSYLKDDRYQNDTEAAAWYELAVRASASRALEIQRQQEVNDKADELQKCIENDMEDIRRRELEEKMAVNTQKPTGVGLLRIWQVVYIPSILLCVGIAFYASDVIASSPRWLASFMGMDSRDFPLVVIIIFPAAILAISIGKYLLRRLRKEDGEFGGLRIWRWSLHGCLAFCLLSFVFYPPFYFSQNHYPCLFGGIWIIFALIVDLVIAHKRKS